jgi:hypothetical protein
MTRPRHEIMRDLKAILAELDFVLNGPDDLRDEPLRLPGAYPASTPEPTTQQSQELTKADLCRDTAKDARKRNYIPSDPLHEDGFSPSDFIGTGDDDPLGHDALSRRR